MVPVPFRSGQLRVVVHPAGVLLTQAPHAGVAGDEVREACGNGLGDRRRERDDVLPEPGHVVVHIGMRRRVRLRVGGCPTGQRLGRIAQELDAVVTAPTVPPSETTV